MAKISGLKERGKHLINNGCDQHTCRDLPLILDIKGAAENGLKVSYLLVEITREGVIQKRAALQCMVE